MRAISPSVVSLVLAALTLAGCAATPGIVGSGKAPAASASAVTLAAPVSAGSAKGPLTIESAAQRAVAWHPSVREAAAKVNQQKAGIDEARAGYGPTLGWDVGTSYVNGGGNQPAVNLTGSQTLLDFGKTDGKVRVATAGTDRSRAELLLTVDQVAFDTATALLEVQRNRRLLEIAKQRVADTEAIRNLVSNRTKAGAGTQSDMLQAEARLEAARTAAIEIETQLVRWENAALSLTGTAPPLRITGGTPAWMNGSCPAGSPSDAPAVSEAEARLALATAEYERLMAETAPSVKLEGSVGGTFDALRDADPDYRIGLKVGGNLYDGGATAARLEAAKHAADASKAGVALAKLEAQRGVAEAGALLGSYKRLQGTLARSLDALDQTRTLYRSQYGQLGTRTLLDVLNAEDEYHLARLDEAGIGFDIKKLSLGCVQSSGKMREVLGLTGKSVQGVPL